MQVIFYNWLNISVSLKKKKKKKKKKKNFKNLKKKKKKKKKKKILQDSDVDLLLQKPKILLFLQIYWNLLPRVWSKYGPNNPIISGHAMNM